MIWFKLPTIEGLNRFPNNGLASHIGIEYIEVGDDYLIARMIVKRPLKHMDNYMVEHHVS